MKEIERWAKKRIADALGTWRVVYVSGARQCGKTTLARQFEREGGGEYRSLDELSLLQVARVDPAGFVERRKGCLILDEVQKAPELLGEIKMAVDRNGEKGQYLLTGSAKLSALPAVTESLAGRMGTIRLRTMAEGELRGAEAGFVDRVFGRDFEGVWGGADKRTVLGMAFRGGYPEAMELAPRKRREWFRAYLDAVLLHDARELADIRAAAKLRGLAEALLARSARFFTAGELAAGFGLKHETLERFLGVLKTMYLVDEVPAWRGGDYDGVGKRPKWFAGDTGMMAAVLGWREDEVFLDGDRSGKAVETWVYHELAAQADLRPGVGVWHYRDRKKREIDFLLEAEDGALAGIEVKAGSAVKSDDFVALAWFREHAAKGRKFTGVVLYAGERTLRFGEGLYAVPLGALCS
jgi:hypothetical protein